MDIRKFETPTLPITLTYDDGTIATDLVFDYVLFTALNEGYSLEKRVEFSEVEEAKFNIEFTQEETGALTDGTVYEMQLNIMIGNRRIPTDIKRGKVERNLHNEVIVT